MDTRWLKRVAAVVATGASAAALVMAARRASVRPVTTAALPDSPELPPEPACEEAAPVCGDDHDRPASAASGAATDALDQTDEVDRRARETAILYAHEVVSSAGPGGGHVRILSIGDVQVTERQGEMACVAVPLELWRQAPGSLPRKERASLSVYLRGGPDSWRGVAYEWDEEPRGLRHG